MDGYYTHKRIDELKQERRELRDMIAAMMTGSSEMAYENTKLQEENDNQKKTITNLEEELRATQKTLSHEATQAGELIIENSQLGEMIEDKDKTISSMDAMDAINKMIINDFEKKSEDDSQTIANMRGELEAAYEGLKQRDSLKQESRDLHSDLDTYAYELQQLRKENDRLNKQIKKQYSNGALPGRSVNDPFEINPFIEYPQSSVEITGYTMEAPMPEPDFASPDPFRLTAETRPRMTDFQAEICLGGKMRQLEREDLERILDDYVARKAELILAHDMIAYANNELDGAKDQIKILNGSISEIFERESNAVEAKEKAERAVTNITESMEELRTKNEERGQEIHKLQTLISDEGASYLRKENRRLKKEAEQNLGLYRSEAHKADNLEMELIKAKRELDSLGDDAYSRAQRNEELRKTKQDLLDTLEENEMFVNRINELEYKIQILQGALENIKNYVKEI